MEQKPMATHGTGLSGMPGLIAGVPGLVCLGILLFVSACGSDGADSADADSLDKSSVTDTSSTADTSSATDTSTPTIVITSDDGSEEVIEIPTDAKLAQQVALEDGELDPAEYQAAFDNFSRCVTAAGHEFHSVETDPESGQIIYTTRDQDKDVVDKCYWTHFDRVDLFFQETNPVIQEQDRRTNELHFLQSRRPCLEANGVEIPEDVEGLEDDADLKRQWVELTQAQAC